MWRKCSDSKLSLRLHLSLLWHALDWVVVSTGEGTSRKRVQARHDWTPGERRAHRADGVGKRPGERLADLEAPGGSKAPPGQRPGESSLRGGSLYFSPGLLPDPVTFLWDRLGKKVGLSKGVPSLLDGLEGMTGGCLGKGVRRLPKTGWGRPEGAHTSLSDRRHKK